MASKTREGNRDLGNALQKARRRRRLSQSAVAAEIGISRKTLARIEATLYVAHTNTRTRIREWLAAEERTAAAAERAAAEQAAAEEAAARRRKLRPIASVTVSIALRRTIRRKAVLAHRRAVAKKMTGKRRRGARRPQGTGPRRE